MNEDPFRIGEGGPPSGSREGRHGDEQADPALRGEFRTLGLDAFLYVRGGHKRALGAAARSAGPWRECCHKMDTCWRFGVCGCLPPDTFPEETAGGRSQKEEE